MQSSGQHNGVGVDRDQQSETHFSRGKVVAIGAAFGAAIGVFIGSVLIGGVDSASFLGAVDTAFIMFVSVALVAAAGAIIGAKIDPIRRR